MIRLIIFVITLSFCFRSEAQIGLQITLKAGVRTYGNSTFLPYESRAVSEDTWYTYSGAVYIPKMRVAFEWTKRELGRYAFVKIPNFLRPKPNVARPFLNRLPQKGDTVGTYLEFYPNWFSVSFNAFPNKWKKHQLLIGAGLIKRNGGLLIVEYNTGFEALYKVNPSVSQKTVLWKSEYIFMPFKYSLLSLRCNYAYFSKFPHGYYEFVLSFGTYIDL